jgi:hypothetical protein
VGLPYQEAFARSDSKRVAGTNARQYRLHRLRRRHWQACPAVLEGVGSVRNAVHRGRHLAAENADHHRCHQQRHRHCEHGAEH